MLFEIFHEILNPCKSFDATGEDLDWRQQEPISPRVSQLGGHTVFDLVDSVRVVNAVASDLVDG